MTRSESVLPLLGLSLLVGMGVGAVVTLVLIERVDTPAYEARDKATVVMWLLSFVALAQIVGVMIYAGTRTIG
jgi:hypothetical protein